jgi:hypothetical protein
MLWVMSWDSELAFLVQYVFEMVAMFRLKALFGGTGFGG